MLMNGFMHGYAGAKEKESKMSAKGAKYEVPAQYKEEGEWKRFHSWAEATCSKVCTPTAA